MDVSLMDRQLSGKGDKASSVVWLDYTSVAEVDWDISWGPYLLTWSFAKGYPE